MVNFRQANVENIKQSFSSVSTVAEWKCLSYSCVDSYNMQKYNLAEGFWKELQEGENNLKKLNSQLHPSVFSLSSFLDRFHFLIDCLILAIHSPQKS